MAVVELTPQDVSAAVERDVTQLAGKGLLPLQKLGARSGLRTLGRREGGARVAPPSAAPSRVTAQPTALAGVLPREPPRPASTPRARRRGRLRPLRDRPRAPAAPSRVSGTRAGGGAAVKMVRAGLAVASAATLTEAASRVRTGRQARRLTGFLPRVSKARPTVLRASRGKPCRPGRAPAARPHRRVCPRVRRAGRATPRPSHPPPRGLL